MTTLPTRSDRSARIICQLLTLAVSIFLVGLLWASGFFASAPANALSTDAHGNRCPYASLYENDEMELVCTPGTQR
jgi:hypothetical protein